MMCAPKRRNVRHVTASSRAFAALLKDGSVVCWGNPQSGGDCSRVQDQLKGWTAGLIHADHCSQGFSRPKNILVGGVMLVFSSIITGIIIELTIFLRSVLTTNQYPCDEYG